MALAEKWNASMLSVGLEGIAAEMTASQMNASLTSSHVRT